MITEEVFNDEVSNYIVVRRSGKEIIDVWKLQNAVIQYHSTNKGWRIKTNIDAIFYVQGDIEIWQIDGDIEESNLWKMYFSYHQHSAEESYRETFTLKPPPPPPPPPKRSLWPYTIKWNWGKM